MSITWLFTTKDQHREEPKIASQVSNISSNVLTLRNPWVTDSVFMGKLYTAMIIGMAALAYPWTLDPENSFEGACDLMTMYLLTPFTFAPFLIYRIIYIKKLSNIYLNRLTKAIYYKRFSTLITFDWNEVNGGLFKRIEFAGLRLALTTH